MASEEQGQMMCLYFKAGPSSLMFQKHEEKPSIDHKVRVGGYIAGKTKEILKKGWK